LDVVVAVRLDAETLLGLVEQDLRSAGEEYLAQGQISHLEAEDGGASATVTDPAGESMDVWVGVVNGALTGECDCPDREPEALCGHAVAVALAALGQGIAWSSIASPPAAVVDQEERRFAEVARELTQEKLIGLVSQQAAADRYFAAQLLAAAGRLAPPGPDEIKAGREFVEAAARLTDGPGWQVHDIVTAGTIMAAELELLAARPANAELLALMEEAIEVWDRLVVHIYDAGEAEDGASADIGIALADLHVQLCEECGPEPVELARRLAHLVNSAEAESFLEAPDAYAEILGPDGLAEFEAQTKQPAS
jgi:hypothetical protein